MKIKTFLAISLLAFAAFAAAIGTMVFLATARVAVIVERRTQAEAVMKEAFELHALTQDFVAYHEDRAKAQWHLEYALLERVLAAPSLQDASSAEFLRAFREEMRGMRASFERLVARSEDAERNDALERRVSGEIVTRTRRMISLADAFAKQTAEERELARTRADRLTFILLCSLVVGASAMAFALYRRIVDPILRLQKGAEVVGKGNLKYKLGIESDDEIGRLSRAFDAMTAKLKRSHDNLERKVKERTAELEMLGRKNEIMLQSIGDGVVAIDTDWNIILWNASAAKLTGWSHKEALGKPFRSIVKFLREQDRAENVLFISDAMLSGKVRFMENHTILVRKDGTEIPVGDSAAPIVDAKGNTIGVIIIFRDSTAERDALLIRSSFAYASHQLRTPVTEALWSIEAAIQEATAETKEKLYVALDAMKSVKKLVTELVLVSEIDQRTVVPRVAETPVAELLEEVMKQAREEAAPFGVTFAVAPMAETITVSTDPKLLAKALHEIVHNAVIYSSKGGEVRVSATMQKNTLLIEVRDRGIGIPAEQQSLVFTKFFRGQNIDSGIPGAGLGLYIAREYLHLLGGKIWFVSEAGTGSTFSLTVPMLNV